MARKLKPVDPATRARFSREKKCFQPDHDRKIEDLQGGIEDKTKMIAVLEEVISNLKIEKMDMITKGEAEEQVKTARMEGYREGEQEATEALKKEKHCFDALHSFVEDKQIMNLDFNQVMNLFLYIVRMPIGGAYRVTVLAPKGFSPKGSRSALETENVTREAYNAVFRKRPFIQ